MAHLIQRACAYVCKVSRLRPRRSVSYWLSGSILVSTSICLSAANLYYVTDDLKSSDSGASFWFINGAPAEHSEKGLTFTSTSGVSYISRVNPPSGINSEEVAVTLGLQSSGGTYVIYLQATPNSLLGPQSTGTFYAFALKDPTFAAGGCIAMAVLNKVVDGSVFEVTSTSIPCGPTSIYYAAIDDDSRLHLSFGNVEYVNWKDSSPLTGGAGGIGGSNVPPGNGISLVQIGSNKDVEVSSVSEPPLVLFSKRASASEYFADNEAKPSYTRACSSMVIDESDFYAPGGGYNGLYVCFPPYYPAYLQLLPVPPSQKLPHVRVQPVD